MKVIRRFLALAMTLALVLSFFPGVPMAFAADDPVVAQATLDGEYIRLDIKTNVAFPAAKGFRFVVTPPEGLNFEESKTQFFNGFIVTQYSSTNIIMIDNTLKTGIDVPAGSVLVSLFYPDVCENSYSVEVAEAYDKDWDDYDVLGMEFSEELITHVWGEPSYAWADDYGSVTATHVCTKNSAHVETETVNTTSAVTTDPTCEGKGKTTYTATFTKEGFTTQTKEIENIDPIGHDWGEPSYEWSADYSSVTAKRVCTRDSSHIQTEAGNVTSKVTKDPTCEGKGETTYTATFTNPAFTTQTEVVPDIDALGHDWGEPTYEWAADNSSVTAKRVCTRDSSHVETETASTTSEVTTDPTCEGKGKTTYTATFTNPAFTTQTKTLDDVDPIGHDWGEPTYEWSADHSSVTAKRVCTRDSSHIQTEAGNVTSEVTKDPTCEEKGETTYTATFTNPAFATQTEVVPDIDALGHDWGEPSYEWAADNSSVTASHVCNRNSAHKETETVSTTSEVTTDPTCEGKGKTTYTATFTKEGFTTQTKTVDDVDPIGHDWGEPTYEWAADYSSVTAKRVCKRDGTHIQTEAGNVTSEVTKQPTCEGKGETTYTATFTNPAFATQTEVVPNIPALEHDWGEPSYEWSADHSSITATRVCKRDSSHVETEPGQVTSEVTTDPTCLTMGKTTYTATFTNPAFATQIETVEDVPALNHDWGEPSYEWAEDYSSITAKRVCKRDGTHIETESGKVTSEVTKQPTCEGKGETTYTATFENTAFATQTEVVPDIPALGHDWDAPEYEWTPTDDGYTVSATAVCKRDANHKAEETVTAGYEVITEPTLGVEGKGLYTAIFTKAPFTTQTKEVTIPKLGKKITVTNYATGGKNPSNGATCSIDADELYYGSVTFTVTSNAADQAVAVFVKDGETYTRLDCTTTDGVHSFTIQVTEPTEIVMAFKGDANLNGEVEGKDSTIVKSIAVNAYAFEDEIVLRTMVSDIDCDGALKGKDGSKIGCAVVGSYTIPWENS